MDGNGLQKGDLREERMAKEGMDGSGLQKVDLREERMAKD